MTENSNNLDDLLPPPPVNEDKDGQEVTNPSPLASEEQGSATTTAPVVSDNSEVVDDGSPKDTTVLPSTPAESVSPPETLSPSATPVGPTETADDSQTASTKDDPATPVAEINEAPVLTPDQIRQQNIDKLLSRVAPVGTKSYFKVLIYGPPGGSKSSFLNIPNTLIYDQEDGLISLKSWAIQNGTPIAENLQAIPFTSFAQADFLLSNLTARIPELDWVEVFAIDTMNDFHRKSLMNEVVARAHNNAPSSISRWVPKTEHHQENNEKMLDFVRRLRDLDRNIILTAHSKTVEPKDKPAKTYPDFSESLANKIEAMMDIVGYMEMQEENGEFFPVMRVKANAGIHAKSRVPLPALIKNPTYEGLKAAWKSVVDA